MTTYQSQTIYALLIIATGMFLSSMAYYSMNEIQYIVAIGFFLSAIFAFITAFKSKNTEIRMSYHVLHALGMVAYSLAIVFGVNDVQDFFDYTVFFLMYYGFAEVIFSFQVWMMSQRRINFLLILYRLIVGIFIIIGTIYILANNDVAEHNAMLISGAVFIFSGFGVLILTSAVKRADKMRAL